jgi:hypothetical protein
MSGEFDPFGGWKKVVGQATGFFHLEAIGERDWLITPDGHGFLSLGINHIDATALKYPDNLLIWRKKYASEENFIQQGVRTDILAWGFNTIGWTQEANVANRTHTPPWTQTQYHLAKLPYCHLLPFSEIEMWNKYPRFPDVFAAEFAEWCDYIARLYCVDMADDPWLIGYFYSDVPAWGTHPNRSAWADQLDGQTARGRAELGRIAGQYYRTIHDAIRRYDQHHLLLGDRYNGQYPLPEIVLTAMADTVDVLSIQCFPPLDRFADQLPRWHELTHKPVLLADSAFLARNPLYRVHAQTEEERGRLYAEWAEKLFRVPYFIGWHWCGYIENLCHGAGLKNHFDEPYTAAIRGIQQFNARVYPLVSGEPA